eukprot:jgi/Mesen1/11011/ME000098S10407
MQHKGSVSFREAWIFPIEESFLHHEVTHVPPPVVIDLNGDGRPEVIFVTREAQLQVIEPERAVSEGDGFRESRLLAEVALAPTRVRVSTGRYPVALAAGHLEAPGSGKRAKTRKAVIVVVTTGWSILCFDHNLKLLWENNVQEDFPHGARHKEVSVLISNQTMRHGDTGVVIVGGSMEIQPQVMDPLEEEEEMLQGIERHRHSAGKTDGSSIAFAHAASGSSLVVLAPAAAAAAAALGSFPAPPAAAAAELAPSPLAELEDVTGGAAGMKERHFSYYAYAGKSGVLRWKHDSKVECRDYRESVLKSMPHRWERRDDTRFELVHFRKHRRRPHKALPGPKGGAQPHHGPPARHLAGRDASNPVAHAVKKKGEHHPAHVNGTAHWWAPNAMVVHLKEGIEAIHLYSGRTICKLLLTAGGLHADINGDGVLDHVQVSGAHTGESTMAAGAESPMKPCWAVATSGVPVKEQLFNGSVCKHSPSERYSEMFGFGHRGFGESNEAIETIEVATPIIMPKPEKGRHRRRSHGDVIFLNSRGEVTAYTVEGGVHHHHGKMRWQVSSDAHWYNERGPAGFDNDPVVPTLMALPLRVGGPPEVILAGGESAAVVLSPHGVEETSFSVPMGSVSPFVVADFNNDNLNDLILVTALGLYGFQQVRQPGAVLFSSLLGVLILCMGVVFVTQHVGPARGKPRKGRSTD